MSKIELYLTEIWCGSVVWIKPAWDWVQWQVSVKAVNRLRIS